MKLTKKQKIFIQNNLDKLSTKQIAKKLKVDIYIIQKYVDTIKRNAPKKQEANFKYYFIFCVFIFILTFIVYANSLKNGFVYDDIDTIVENSFIKDVKNIKYIFTTDYFNMFRELTYRPVCTITFFVDYFLYKLKPFGWHLTNILFHILNSILIFFLALKIFKGRYILSLFTSLLFAIHPLTTEPVNAISFREDLIAMSFFLISFLFYIRFFNTKKLFYFSLSLIAFILALFSKESAVILPLILILYTFSFEEGREISRRKYYFAVYFIILLIYIYLTRYSILSNPDAIKLGYHGGSLYTTLLTVSKIFASYIKLFILPVDLRPDYVVLVSHSLFEPLVIMSILILMIFIGIGILMWKYNKIIFFSTFYFFITLIPTSHIIPLHILMAERYMYIPLVSFCIITSVLIYKGLLISQVRFTNQIAIPKFANYFKSVFSVGLIICYSLLTFNQNKVWRNDMVLLKTTLKRCPKSIWANYRLGVIYEKKGELDKAEDCFNKIIALDNRSPWMHYTLGVIYNKKGLLDKAQKCFKRALELNVNYAEAYNNLGVIYAKKGLLNKAEECFKRALELNVNYAEAYNNLGVIYKEKERIVR